MQPFCQRTPLVGHRPLKQFQSVSASPCVLSCCPIAVWLAQHGAATAATKHPASKAFEGFRCHLAGGRWLKPAVYCVALPGNGRWGQWMSGLHLLVK